MQPTIAINSHIIVDETHYSNDLGIERFDIIMHKRPITEKDKRFNFDENTKFVSRVVALGGETVEVKKGQVFVNEKPLSEPFEKFSSDDDFGSIVVPENEFFLLGDNRPGSDDSRIWKPSTIKRENILGKVVKIF